MNNFQVTIEKDLVPALVKVGRIIIKEACKAIIKEIDTKEKNDTNYVIGQTRKVIKR